MANRLIRYDATLLRHFLADNFRGPADALLLALVGTIAGFWLSRQPFVLPPTALWLAMAAGPAGFAWQRLARRRLAWLAEHAAVAPAALDTRERRAWLCLAHLLAGLLLLAGALLLGIAVRQPLPATALAVAAYASGAVLAAIPFAARTRPARSRPSVTPLPGGRQAVLTLILARQTRGTRRPLRRAGLLLLASFLLAVAAGWWGRSLTEPLRSALPLLPSLVILLLSARLDAGLLGFLPSAGLRPGAIAWAVSALPFGSLIAASGALLLVGAGPGALIVAGLIHLAFILIGISRAWLYPGRTARSVELQLQLECAGLAAAAVLLPPLAVAASLWRLGHFYTHCRARRWMPA